MFTYWKKFIVKLGFLTNYLDFIKTFTHILFPLIIQSKPKCNWVQFEQLLRFCPLFTFISVAIEVSSNKAIIISEGMFQCNVSKSINLLTFDATQQVWLCNKRPVSSAIFREISKAHATNFIEEDIKNRIEELKNKNKLVNNKTAAGLDSFFVTWFIKETFTECNTEPIRITQQTPEVCRVSTHRKIAILTLRVSHLWNYI